MYVVLEYVHKDSEETRGPEFKAVLVGMMHRVGAIETGSCETRHRNACMHEFLFFFPTRAFS